MLALAVTAVLIAFLFALPIEAEESCGAREKITGHLESEYDEKLAAIGMAGSGGVLELWKSDKGGWTLLLTQANGVTCLIAAGMDWMALPEELKGQGI